MRRIGILTAVLCAAVLFPTVAFAGVDSNILDNASFDQGGTGWDYTQTVLFGDMWNQQTIAYDPAGAAGEGGYLRQVVDASRSVNWDGSYNDMTAETSFWLYTTGTGYCKVGFSWWDSISIAKPTPGSTPDHYVILGDTFTSLNNWSQVTVPYDWAGQIGNNNPKWVAVEFYFMDVNGSANEAGVDEVTFTARSVNVPEPSSLLAALGGLVGLTGLIRRRRH